MMHKRIAKIKSTSLGFDRGAFLTAWLHVDYGGSAQGIGGFMLGVNAEASETKHPRPTKAGCEFLIRVLEACGVERWEQLAGRTIFVLLESDNWNARPVGIENLPTEPGCQFLFKAWQDRAAYEQEVEAKLLKDDALDRERWLVGWSHRS